MNFPFEIRRDAEFDGAGFGTNAVDFLIGVPTYPAFNSKAEITNYEQLAGGEVASTMAGLSRLGLRTLYAGRFGSDTAGNFGISSLRSDEVDLRYAETIEGARTQIAFIVIDERSGERTVMWQRDAALSYSAEDAPISAAGAARVLHLTPHDVGACIAMSEAARAAGTIVSTDIDNLFEGMNRLLPLVDVLVTSHDIPKRLTGVDDLRHALPKMQEDYGCPIVGVTLGDQGSLIYCGKEFIETAGFEVPGGCKDTTGAGDAFRVGLLYGLISGDSIEESARAANAVAALKCRAVGARTALPSRAELEAFLRDHK
jgi:sulfofructose kinase